MYTQNTPVHIHLWHHDFWRMSIANMLITMSMYMFMPVLPLWLMKNEHFTMGETGIAMGVFALGLFSLGGFCTYFVQRFRRNTVCMLSIIVLIAITAIIYYSDTVLCRCLTFYQMLAIRFVQGAFYGLTQMVLCSTLIIDISESYKRTEANHSSAWFGRFALSLGPLLAVFTYQHFGFDIAMIVSMACAFCGLVLIYIVRIPFRTPPDDIPVFTKDRFFLPQGIWLFINLLMVTAAMGLIFTIEEKPAFYGMIMCGFLFAIIAQRMMFVNAELESETIIGLLAMTVAIIMMITRHQVSVSYIAPAMLGFGVGLIGSRFLLFFIKLSHHCERGTSQSTYILSWESGLAIGLFIGYSALNGNVTHIYELSLGLLAVSFLMYHFFTHKWYMKHKNR